MIRKIIIGGMSLIRVCFSRLILRKNIRCGIKIEISRNATMETIGNGKITLGNSVHLWKNTVLKANKGATIEVGEHTSFNNGTIIVSRERITIGSGCSFGPGVMVYDHDHDFKSTLYIKEDNYITKSVQIGNNVWIGANSVILKGSRIEDNVVIAAGSIVTGVIPENSIYIQKRETTMKKIDRTLAAKV